MPLVIVPIACYYAIVNSIDDHYKTWSGRPLTCLLLLGGAALYRWPAARFTDWHTWLYYTLAYVAAGFAVALYKWIAVLVEFRKGDVTGDIARARQRVTKDADERFAADLLLNRIVDNLARDYRGHIVESTPDGSITIWPDWRKHPIATHWTYWPFFVLSIPLDWLTHGIEWAADRLKDFWNGIAQRFSVKG